MFVIIHFHFMSPSLEYCDTSNCYTTFSVVSWVFLLSNLMNIHVHCTFQLLIAFGHFCLDMLAYLLGILGKEL